MGAASEKGQAGDSRKAFERGCVALEFTHGIFTQSIRPRAVFSRLFITNVSRTSTW